MSDTKKTDPHLVRLWHRTLHRVAEHDHRNGVCDLPVTFAEHVAQSAGGWGSDDARCRWVFGFAGVNPCCCELCRCQSARRRETKGTRRRTAIDLGEAVKACRAGEAPDLG